MLVICTADTTVVGRKIPSRTLGSDTAGRLMLVSDERSILAVFNVFKIVSIHSPNLGLAFSGGSSTLGS
jgi:hypothetical protein